MDSEIQEPLLYSISETQIRELDPDCLQKECFVAVRQAFIAQRAAVPLFKQFNIFWLERLSGIILKPVLRDLRFPLQMKIPSSIRESFRFPRHLIRSINKGYILLEISEREDWELLVSHLEKRLESALKDEILSWFYPIWKDIDGCPMLPSGNRDRIEASPLYREWLSAFRLRHTLIGQSKFPSRIIFRFKAARLVKEIISPEKTPVRTGHRSTLSHNLLCYRCHYQRQIRILKKSLDRMFCIWDKKISWLSYSVPVFSLGVLFFTLILNHYSHSLPFIIAEPDGSKVRDSNSLELSSPDWLLTDPARDKIRIYGGGSLAAVEEISRIAYNTGSLQGVFWYEKEFGNRLFLTFDDGPNLERVYRDGKETSVTAGILDILKEKGIQAVFFINGKQLAFQSQRKERELRILLNRMIKEGHLIGNHSYHHDNLARGIYQDGRDDLGEIREEFDSTQRELNRIIGYTYPLILIRPPYAEPGRSSLLDRLLTGQKQYLVSLQFDSYDYAYRENGYWQQDQLLKHIKNLILPSRGGILLMHDKASSLPLLEDLLDDSGITSTMTFSRLSDILMEKYGQKKQPPL